MEKENSSLSHRECLERIRQNPDDYRNWLLLGWTTKDPATAIKFFEHALQLAPDDSVALDSIAWARENLKTVNAASINKNKTITFDQPNSIPGANPLTTSKEIIAKGKSQPQIEEEHNRKIAFAYVAAYLVLITLAEGLSANLSVVNIGLIVHGLILATLLLHSALTPGQREQRLYLTLAFAPLIRLVSLSTPLKNVPMTYWYLLVGAPLFLSIFLAARYAGFTLKQIGITMNYWPAQILFGVFGVGLGYVEYLILRPQPLIQEMTIYQIWLPALILVIFTGLLEEMIFRGLMQQAFASLLGRWKGLIFVSLLFAVMHLGYKSLLDVAFVFGVAILFGIITINSGSILGATIAHGLTNVTLFLVFPFIIGQPVVLSQNPESAALRAQVTVTPGSPNSTATPAHTITVTIEAALASIITNTPISTILPIYSATPTATPIVVDDGDIGFSRHGGAWWKVNQGIDGDLLWSYASFDQPNVDAEWEANFKECGIYTVEVSIPNDYATTHSITYEIEHAKGTTRLVIDQKANQGKWVNLGEYWFDPLQPGKISATNKTGEANWSALVAFDAIRWKLVERCSK